MPSGPAPDTTGPDDASMACPACQYSLHGLQPAPGTQGVICPECGANSVDAPIQIAARRRITRFLARILAYFAARAIFYAIVTSDAARHMSMFLNNRPWQYFKDTELSTLAGRLEFIWRIVSVPIAFALLVAFIARLGGNKKREQRTALLREIAYSMIVIELGIHAWWIVGP